MKKTVVVRPSKLPHSSKTKYRLNLVTPHAKQVAPSHLKHVEKLSNNGDSYVSMSKSADSRNLNVHKQTDVQIHAINWWGGGWLWGYIDIFYKLNISMNANNSLKKKNGDGGREGGGERESE